MTVTVEYRGNEYTYSQVGKIMTWTDHRKMVIPVMLHSILREKAISLGTDSSIFISKKKVRKVPEEVGTAKKVVSVKKQKNQSMMGGFNPFN